MNIPLSGKSFGVFLVICVVGFFSGAPAQTCTDYSTLPHWLTSSDTAGTALAVVSKGDHLYVADGAAGLQVINVVDLENPVTVHTVSSAADARDVVISGNQAFVAAGDSGLQIVDITDPGSAFVLGFAGTSGFASGVFVQDDLAYVAVQDFGLLIFDVADPAAPLLLDSVATSGTPHGVTHGIWKSRPYAFVAGGTPGVQIIHTGDLAAAEVVDVTSTPGSAKNVIYKNELLYVADGSQGLTVLSMAPKYFSEAYWLFSGNGNDLTGGHPATLVGSAQYVEIVEENEIIIQGLFTNDSSGHAEYAPPLEEIFIGRISFKFKLDAPFGPDPDFSNSVDIITSDRPGNNAGDFRVGLDPVDGTMVLSQDDPQAGPPVDLRTSLDAWEADIWYTVRIDWDDQGRDILVSWFDQFGSYSDSQADNFASSCFSADTLGNLIGSRGIDAPPVGLSIDWLRVEDSHPKGSLSGNLRLDGYAQDLVFRDDHAFVALEYGDLQIVDFTLPSFPAVVGSVDTPTHSHGVAVTADHVFLADREAGVIVARASSPESPLPLGVLDTPGPAYGVSVAGSLAFVADREFGLQVMDITSPDFPQLWAGVETAGHAMEVAVSGTRAYVAEAVFSQVADKSLLAAVFPKGSNAVSDAKAGRYSGLEIVDFSVPTAPVVTGVVETPGYALDVEVAGSHVFVADFEGLVVIDAADPGAPYIAASLPTPGKARDLAVSGAFAFVADLAGLQVIDIANPAAPQLIGSVATPGMAYGVAIEGTTAYVADVAAGLIVLDVTDPSSPLHLGTVATQGGAYDVEVIGNFAYVADGYDTDYSSLLIVDVSDPSAPFIAGGVDSPQSIYGMDLEGDHAFITDGGLGLSIFQRQCDTGGPAHFSGFALTRDDGKVSFTWNSEPGGGPDVYRLTGAKGESEWEIPFARDGEGCFTASDPLADEHGGETVTYSLFHLESAEEWVVIATEEVFFEAPRIITRLLGAHPNPFNPHTTVSFSVEKSQRVKIRVYDLAGRLVSGLVDQVYEPGYYTADWNGKNGSGGDVSSGIYFLRMEAADLAEVKKITLVR